MLKLIFLIYIIFDDIAREKWLTVAIVFSGWYSWWSAYANVDAVCNCAFFFNFLNHKIIMEKRVTINHDVLFTYIQISLWQCKNLLRMFLNRTYIFRINDNKSIRRLSVFLFRKGVSVLMFIAKLSTYLINLAYLCTTIKCTCNFVYKIV